MDTSRAKRQKDIRVSEVPIALHIRTGQRALVEAVDAWLVRHAVEVIAFDDVYAACAFVLQPHERSPDLALVGTDWLADDEYPIIAYVRQTWPRTAILVYSQSGQGPRSELLPFTRHCRGAAELEACLSGPPDVVLRSLGADWPVGDRAVERRCCAPAAAERPTGPPPAVVDVSTARHPELLLGGLKPAPADAREAIDVALAGPPRMVLTAEELAALLGTGRPR